MKKQKETILKIVLCVLFLLHVQLGNAQCNFADDGWCDWGNQIEMCPDRPDITYVHYGRDIWLRSGDTLIFHNKNQRREFAYIIPYAGQSFCLDARGDTLARICAMEIFDSRLHQNKTCDSLYECAGMTLRSSSAGRASGC